MQVPQIVRDTAKAIDFPSKYQKALVYLEQCARVDEVKEFSDQVAAAAIYYRQKNDRQAMIWLKRIQLNSATRLGLLLKDLETRMQSAHDSPESYAETASESVRVSSIIQPKERLNCLRIAELDEGIRTEKIDSERPPTVNMLADLSRRLQQPKPRPPTAREKREQELDSDRSDILWFINELIDLSEKYTPEAAIDVIARMTRNIRAAHDEQFSIHKTFLLGDWLKSIGRLYFRSPKGKGK